MRIVLGIIVGLVVAVACVFVIEFIGHNVFPPPPGTDLTNPADVERLMSVMPTAALAFVIMAYFVGALFGAWVANVVAKRGFAGWIVALLVIAGSVLTMVSIPHPAWMWVTAILLPLIAGWLAQRFAKVAA